MCLIVFSYKQHPTYDLIFAANRDENYNRPTRAAQFWDDHPTILAGKDLKAGGTWMGITKRGRFAALTNYRDPSIQKENPPSRGRLVLDFLKRGNAPTNYLRNIHSKANRYMGFNLLAGTINELWYYSNQGGNKHKLDSGLYGLSNHLLDTPWPKVERAKKNLRHLMKDKQISEQALFDLLADDHQAPDDELPDTGIPQNLEKKVSPIFIQSDDYGTRCSTVLLVGKDGTITFNERRYKPGTMEVKNENRYQFSIEK